MSVAELCRHEGISPNLYYNWSKEIFEAGKSRLMGGDTQDRSTLPADISAYWIPGRVGPGIRKSNRAKAPAPPHSPPASITANGLGSSSRDAYFTNIILVVPVKPPACIRQT